MRNLPLLSFFRNFGVSELDQVLGLRKYQTLLKKANSLRSMGNNWSRWMVRVSNNSVTFSLDTGLIISSKQYSLFELVYLKNHTHLIGYSPWWFEPKHWCTKILLTRWDSKIFHVNLISKRFGHHGKYWWWFVVLPDSQTKMTNGVYNRGHNSPFFAWKKCSWFLLYSHSLAPIR